MANSITTLITFLYGTKKGEDSLGNKYYQSRFKKYASNQLRRWVIYRDLDEASLVPAQYHAWLHYTTDEFPQKNSEYHQTWQKPHLANMTGTDAKYLPTRAHATGDYQAWQP